MSETFGIHEKALLLHAKRTGLIAENLANTNTPGFKAKDLDFRSVLKGLSSQLALNKTSKGHINLQRSVGEKFVNPLGPTLDGNTVDAEAQKLKLVDAQNRYNASLQFLNGTITSRLQAIKGE
ncbi:flagellar basal body rod protein FlgB [Alteromonas macleodii]|uniref:flagellar basal body rod protein FlgB n=1 Tax=Alteromonas macleodii TaxID=28108 RepID=UPI0031409B20